MSQDHALQQIKCQYTNDLIQNGFFGKPNKLRKLQPSMFELLTWNSNQVEQNNLKINHRQLINTNYKTSSICRPQNSQQKSPRKAQNEYFSSLKKNPQNKIQTCQKSNKKIQTLQSNNQLKTKIKNKYSKIPQIQVQHIESQRTLSKKKHLFYRNQKPKLAFQKQNKSIPKSPIHKKKLSQNVNYNDDSFYEDKQLNQEELIKKFKQTTRWISNSAFTTYFGKPAFQNYGRGNTNPSNGGLMYGSYLKTHNVQPHRGMNSPKNQQSYSVALMKAQKIGTIEPYPPKVCKKQDNKYSSQVKRNNQSQDNSIYPEKNNIKNLHIKHPNLYDLEKFGGKGIKKIRKSSYERLYSENIYQNNQVLKEDKNYFQNFKNQPQYQIKKKPFPKGKKIK